MLVTFTERSALYFLSLLMSASVYVGASALPMLAQSTQGAQRTGTAAEPPATPAERQGSCALEGQVMNAVTGLPMSVVQLTLTSAEGSGQPGSLGTQSNSDGLFRFEGLQPGRYRLDASRVGFLPTKYGSPRYGYPGVILNLVQSQIQRDLVIRMTPQAIVTGRLLDENSDPLLDAQVRIVQTGGNPTGSIAATNDLGEYRIFQIPPGKYYVMATPGLISRLPVVQSATTSGSKRIRVYVPTFHPGVADPLMAIPIELTAGSEVRLPDFALQKIDAVNIKGRVVQAVPQD